MAFEAVNVTESDGAERWIRAGRPLVPSLDVDGRWMPILHVSQIASLLDLPGGEAGSGAGFAYDTITILSSWLELLDGLDWDLLTKPTPSRGRTIRNLTVNTFHPFELVPIAWREGAFFWYPERDPEREKPLTDAAAVRAYASKRLVDWQSFVLDVGDDLEGADHPVRSARGDTTFSVVLTSQRYHCAHHHRQVVHFLRNEGVDVSDVLDVELIHDLGLTADVY